MGMSITDIQNTLKNWFWKRDLQTRIFLLVLGAHILLLLSLLLGQAFQNFFHPEPVKKQIIVATVKLKSTPLQKNSPKTQATPPKEPPKEIAMETSPLKNEKKPKVVDKKNLKKEIKKAPAPSKPAYTSSEVQKALQNLSAIAHPLSFNTLASDEEGEDIADEPTRLAAYIRAWLKLPEFGKVTVRIKFNAEGKILSLETLSSESQLNQKYIEQNLTLLTLPVAKNTGARQSERSLVLVLSNE